MLSSIGRICAVLRLLRHRFQAGTAALSPKGKGMPFPVAGYPKELWRFSSRRRFVPLKAKFQYRGGIRSRGRIVWPHPNWLTKYLDALYRREKRTNWFAIRDLSRRTARRYAEGRKNTFPDCPKNFWDMPYS